MLGCGCPKEATPRKIITTNCNAVSTITVDGTKASFTANLGETKTHNSLVSGLTLRCSKNACAEHPDQTSSAGAGM